MCQSEEKRKDHDEVVSVDRCELAPNSNIVDNDQAQEEFIVDKIVQHRVCDVNQGNDWEVDQHQIVVPKSLQPRLLNMAHRSTVAGHAGGGRMYRTLRRHYYWPEMAIDCYNIVRCCSECAKERVRTRRRKAPLKLCPASAPLQDIAMDILGPFVTRRVETLTC